MEYDQECYGFGVECKEQGLDFAEFLAAFNKAYEPNQHAIDSAKAGFNAD
ncbi:hypothetical protein [Vibrio cyclitrophicus]